MPFPVVHLSIARRILEDNVLPLGAQAFYAGSLAPDSVHFRLNYTIDYKLVSHICPPGWEWATSYDGEGWKRHVLDFYEKNRDAYDRSFLFGVIAHIFADSDWNDEYWMKFVEKMDFDKEKYSSSDMHKDCYEIDTRLFHELDVQDAVFPVLDGARGVEIPGTLSAEELDRMIDSILHEQYAGRDPVPGHVFTAMTYDTVRAFIEEQAREIPRVLACLF